MPIVRLSNDEIRIGVIPGLTWKIKRMEEGRVEAWNVGESDGWQRAIEGSLAEMAFCKFTKNYWSGLIERGADDVNGMEIRVSRYPNAKLLLHESDHDKRHYFLMIGINGTYDIKGWMLGKDGKNSKYWGDYGNTGRPAFWIPQSDLIKI